MPLVPAVLAAGAFMQIAGNLLSNSQQAEAEAKNAMFYMKQAEYARDATIRQAYLSKVEYTKLQGAQVSAYAKGGVDISGSASSVIAGTLAKQLSEAHAIQTKGNLEMQLAGGRAEQSRSNASFLSNPLTAVLSTGSIAANTYAQYEGSK